MKRPNRDTHKETLTQTDYIWYSKSLEKYIDFLESNQKEFEEWLEKEGRLIDGDVIITYDGKVRHLIKPNTKN